MAQLSLQERQQRVSVFLKQVDEEVRQANYEKALELVRKVYEFDIKNVYARAYEERILAMNLERDRQEALEKVQREAEAQTELEVKRRLKEFFQQQEVEEKLKRERERKEKELEEQARKKSTIEVSGELSRNLKESQQSDTKRLAELERKLESKLQQMSSALPAAAGGVEKLREEYEAKLAQVRRQYEEAQRERTKIETDMMARIQTERQKFHEDALRQVEAERERIAKQAQENERTRDIEQYQAVAQLMIRMQLGVQFQQPILKALQISMGISDEKHKEIERGVHVAAYTNAVRELWINGTPSEEELQQFANIQALYAISPEEHKTILGRVKQELGIADKATLALVIEDDLPIRKFAEHMLKKIIPRVHAVENAEQAVEFLKDERPSVILSDINLGPRNMTGFDFLGRLMAGDFGAEVKKIPVVMMSSIVDDLFIKTAEQLGARSYIPKPITKESLEQALSHAMTP